MNIFSKTRPCRHTVAFLFVMTFVALVGACTGVRKPVEGERVLQHTVEQGETLESIANEYYADADRAGEIARFNNVDSDAVRGGDVLRIPVTPSEMASLERREHARGPYNRGLELVERGSYLDAASAFREALEMDPDFAEAHYNLGVTYQQLKSYDRAAQQFKKATRLRPRHVEYRYATGGAYFYLNRYHDAIKWFRKTLELAPRHLKAQYSLAVAYERDARPGKAHRAWQRYLELDSTSDWAAEARQRLELLE